MHIIVLVDESGVVIGMINSNAKAKLQPINQLIEQETKAGRTQTIPHLNFSLPSEVLVCLVYFIESHDQRWLDVLDSTDPYVGKVYALGCNQYPPPHPFTPRTTRKVTKMMRKFDKLVAVANQRRKQAVRLGQQSKL